MKVGTRVSLTLNPVRKYLVPKMRECVLCAYIRKALKICLPEQYINILLQYQKKIADKQQCVDV